MVYFKLTDCTKLYGFKRGIQIWLEIIKTNIMFKKNEYLKKSWCTFHGYHCRNPTCKHKHFEQRPHMEECIICGGDGRIKRIGELRFPVLAHEAGGSFWNAELCDECGGKGVFYHERK